jgi:hypothetical protein
MAAKRHARLNIYIEPEIHSKLKEFSEQSGMSISYFINSLLKGLFDEKIKDATFTEFVDDYAGKFLENLHSKAKPPLKDKIDVESLKSEITNEILEAVSKLVKEKNIT